MIKKHLIIYTRGGHELHVVGESTEDVPFDVIHRSGWVSFDLLNGKMARIYSSEIVAVVEAETE